MGSDDAMRKKFTTGSARKIICCGFSDDVQEYGEVLPYLALGHDPADGSWFLSKDHNKTISFPLKPKRNLFEEADVAEINGASNEEIESINERISATVSDADLSKFLKDIENVQKHTKCHPQDLLRIYDQAKKSGYDVDKDGFLIVWL